MKMTEERKKYLYEYRKANLKRITLDVTPEFYAEFKAVADAEGKAVNTLIKSLLSMYVEHQKKKDNSTAHSK